ncbi:MAG: 2'-deoxycytidine 5'-triphosphate deaminase [Actinobacteria bacterium]|nr:MAG: 2'-deoxycytidine 5'-triphosphate deaminase [Actinomycetota bacterium]
MADGAADVLTASVADLAHQGEAISNAEGEAAQGAVGTDPRNWQPGVLPSQLLMHAIHRGWIRSPALKPDQLQPASLDLTLGAKAYRLLCSFLPDRESRVEEKLADYVLEEFDIAEGAILERNRAYLIPLREELALPESLRGKANPKSSIGRLDVFTRVVSDNNSRFDELPLGYRGPLFLEVVPRSFIIRVREGLSLNQLRLVAGDFGTARYSDSALAKLHIERPILFSEGKQVSSTDLDLADGLFLSLDLTPDVHGHVGYRAARNSRVLDLSVTGRYSWDEFWEPVRALPNGNLILEPEEFYLLLSRESVSISPVTAAEMAAYDPTAGELRTHYAGFFDPGFGFSPVGWPDGSRATLEVRARDVSFVVEHGQRLCRLIFERLVEETELVYGQGIGSTYQDQKLTLSKHFASQGPVGQLTLPDTPPVRAKVGSRSRV